MVTRVGDERRALTATLHWKLEQPEANLRRVRPASHDQPSLLQRVSGQSVEDLRRASRDSAAPQDLGEHSNAVGFHVCRFQPEVPYGILEPGLPATTRETKLDGVDIGGRESGVELDGLVERIENGVLVH